MSDAASTIEKLKARFRVETDADLALRLLLSRSTIANWRNRNSVPSRYVSIADGQPNSAEYWRAYGELNDVERAAMKLAALRIARDFADIAQDYRAFLDRGYEAALAFNSYWQTACVDVMKGMDERETEDAVTVANLIAYSEIVSKE